MDAEKKKETVENCEVSNKDCGCKTCSGANKKVIAGIIMVVVGLIFVQKWWPDIWIVFRGFFGIFLVLAGAVTLAIAKE